MNKALVEGNFEGVFQLQAIGEERREMRIVHRFKDGEMIERLVSTDGSGYEQKRKGTQWAEYLPRQRVVAVATMSDGALFAASADVHVTLAACLDES